MSFSCPRLGAGWHGAGAQQVRRRLHWGNRVRWSDAYGAAGPYLPVFEIVSTTNCPPFNSYNRARLP